MDELIPWLLEGEPYIQYRTRVDLLGQAESDPQVLAARREMLGQTSVRHLIANLAEWPGAPVTSHKKADTLMHQLTFCADLGVRDDDPGMPPVIDRILANQSKEGPFQVMMNIAPAIGGDGRDHLAWSACDHPLTLYSLIRMGLGERQQVQTAARWLEEHVSEVGFLCQVCPELGKFRGPGRASDPCPFATLIALQVLACLPADFAPLAVQAGIDCLLNLWTRREDFHPYIFYMGTDFCKLKAPFIWYDLLHTVDVLSRFTQARAMPAYQEMIQILVSKADGTGRYTPESIWLWWKDWEFGQKKQPSRWLTMLVLRILLRSGLYQPA